MTQSFNLMTQISNNQAWQTHEGLDHSGNDEPDTDLEDGKLLDDVEDGEPDVDIEDDEPDVEDGELLDDVLQTGNPDVLRRVCARRSSRVFL